jgi:hypothetical protein
MPFYVSQGTFRSASPHPSIYGLRLESQESYFVSAMLLNSMIFISSYEGGHFCQTAAGDGAMVFRQLPAVRMPHTPTESV